ncbi:MAG TPA: phosphoribosylglycinamide formyltransferase [Gemmatimonadaceae bacterium]|nr:phosphoribosylglycinamide formyltransferase [Gemmatimonadaceae bacterium]
MAARIAVLASGGGTNLQALIDFYAGERVTAAGTIALVASDRAGAYALERARAAALPAEVFDPSDDGRGLLTLFERYSIDIVVLAGYLRRIPTSVVSAYRDRIINIHPGLLPEFGGPGMYGERVHKAVLESGTKVSGVTVHIVDEEYDHGSVIAQWRVGVREDDTAVSLAARVLSAEHTIYPRVVDMVAALSDLQSRGEF